MGVSFPIVMAERLTVNPHRPDGHTLEQAAQRLRAGQVLAYPTDTLYGLATDPGNPVAVGRLFRAKGRPEDRAVPLIAGSSEQVERVAAELTADARRLAEVWWPGPLTLVVRARAGLAVGVCAPDGSVAVRVPDHAVARGLALTFGSPVTATSANRTGRPPVATAEALDPALVKHLALVLDGGACPGGAPSTIVDVTGTEAMLVREGRVPWERVLESLRR